MTEPNDETAPLGSLGTEPKSPAPASLPADAAPEDDALRALEPDEIRARRRPRTVLLVWAWELACAFIIATPMHAWARRVWGEHPDGDSVIFRPGGHELISWLGDDNPALAIVVRTSILAFVVFAVLGQLVTGALIGSLSTGLGKAGRPPPTRFALRTGAAAFFPMLGIGLIAGALEGFVLGMGLFASSALDHSLQPRLGDARAFTARAVVLALFLVAAMMVGVVADLARVAMARDVALEEGVGRVRTRLRDAIVTAVRTARQAIGRATLAWGWRTAIALVLIYAGAVAGDLVGGRGGGALWGLFVFHQLVILGRAGLRASWLSNALRLVLKTPEAT